MTTQKIIMFSEIENIYICPSSEKKISKTVRVTVGGGRPARVEGWWGKAAARQPLGQTAASSGAPGGQRRGARGGLVRPAGHLRLEALTSSAALMSCSSDKEALAGFLCQLFSSVCGQCLAAKVRDSPLPRHRLLISMYSRPKSTQHLPNPLKKA